MATGAGQAGPRVSSTPILTWGVWYEATWPWSGVLDRGGVCGIGAFFAILTIVQHDWIETLFGVDPDQGNGSVEWIVVVALLVIAAGAGALAGREWRRRTW